MRGVFSAHVPTGKPHLMLVDYNPEDPVLFTSQRDRLDPAFARMRDSGAILTGVISAMYELLGDATHPAFRECLKLAKSIHV